MADRINFALCLWCGQPLRSAFSQHDGFGLQCTQRSGLNSLDRRRLVHVTTADLLDLRVLEQLPPHSPGSRLTVALGLARARLHHR